jgi:hypothetical protein
MFLPYYLLYYIFHVKIQLFVTQKSDKDPDPPGSAFIWLSLVRIRIGNPDPGAWKLAKIYKQTWICAFQKGFCTFLSTVCFLTFYLL